MITNPKVQSSEIPFEIEGNNIIIFDDVLYTGRTIRSAIQGIFKYGRPSKVELAVLIDRGNRNYQFSLIMLDRLLKQNALIHKRLLRGARRRDSISLLLHHKWSHKDLLQIEDLSKEEIEYSCSGSTI